MQTASHTAKRLSPTMPLNTFAMRPFYPGQARCEEIVSGFAEAIVAGPALAIGRAEVVALVDRALAAYSAKHPPVKAADLPRLRLRALEEIADADARCCIPNGTGATAFIVFAFAYGSCLMQTRQLTWNGMKGAMASVDEYLGEVWRQAGVEWAPSTRSGSRDGCELKIR